MQAKEKLGKNWAQLESFVLRTYSIRKFSVSWYLNSEQKHSNTKKENLPVTQLIAIENDTL